MSETEEARVSKSELVNSAIDENRKRIAKTVFVQVGITAGLLGALALGVNTGLDSAAAHEMASVVCAVNAGVLGVSMKRIQVYMQQIKALKNSQNKTPEEPSQEPEIQEENEEVKSL